MRTPLFLFGDEVAPDISQPGGAELSDQGAQAPHLLASGNLGCGYAALNTYIQKSIIFAKILRLRTPDPRGCDFNCRGIFLIPPRL
jgi:hypothetical protein